MLTRLKSPTITHRGGDSAVHPGEVLLEEFLKPLHISPYRLAPIVVCVFAFLIMRFGTRIVLNGGNISRKERKGRKV